MSSTELNRPGLVTDPFKTGRNPTLHDQIFFSRRISMSEKSIFTVMADCGVGEFLWRKDVTDTCRGVGGNLLSVMEVNIGSDDMSEALFADFCAWAKRYMAALPEDVSEPMDLDWPDFNAQGVELARRLSVELAPEGHIVRYARAWDDPKHDKEPFIDF